MKLPRLLKPLHKVPFATVALLVGVMVLVSALWWHVEPPQTPPATALPPRAPLIAPETQAPVPPSAASTDSLSFTGPVKHTDAHATWLAHTQEELRTQAEKIAALETQLKTPSPATPESPAPPPAVTHSETAPNDASDWIGHTTAHDLSFEKEPEFPEPPNPLLSYAPPATSSTPMEGSIRHWTVTAASVTPAPTHSRRRHGEYMPAGTHVPAVLISAADAPAGITSQADPVPVLLRVRGNGPLHNCMLVAAMKGDVSSERAIVRLERLSCTRPNGDILEKSVEGSLSGSDGKNGIKGTPVWREGPLIARAFAAGALSGLSQGVAQGMSQSTATPFGIVNTVPGSQWLQHGAAQGSSRAMDKLAEYHIQRAEQYHPVIQVRAGQTADVIFTKGFHLYETHPAQTETE